MIRLEHIRKTFGAFQLNNINLEVEDGGYYVLLGPTGAGKTVILELISGMYQPDEGRVIIDGSDVTDAPPEDRRIGFVYQDYMLFPHLNVRKNIVFSLTLKKVPKDLMEEKLAGLAEMLHIRHLLDRKPETLSGGEKQRVALARALMSDPGLLLLDEPMSALDPQSRKEFQTELIAIHNALHTTTIHITHNFNEACALADRIGIICEGQLIEEGTPRQIMEQPKMEFTARFVGKNSPCDQAFCAAPWIVPEGAFRGVACSEASDV